MLVRLVDPVRLDEVRLLIDEELVRLHLEEEIHPRSALVNFMAVHGYSASIGQGPEGCFVGWLVDIERKLECQVIASFDQYDVLVALCCLALDLDAAIFYDDVRDARRFMPERTFDHVTAMRERPKARSIHEIQMYTGASTQIESGSDVVAAENSADKGSAKIKESICIGLQDLAESKRIITDTMDSYRQMIESIADRTAIQNILDRQRAFDLTVKESHHFQQLVKQHDGIRQIAQSAEYAQRIADHQRQLGVVARQSDLASSVRQAMASQLQMMDTLRSLGHFGL